MKNKQDKDFKQWLLSKQLKRWLKDNQEMVDDCHRLIGECVMLEIKWGIPVRLVVEKSEESSQGRNLGVGEAEKLFE